MRFVTKHLVVLNRFEEDILTKCRFRTFKVLNKEGQVKAKIVAASVLVGESEADRTFKVNFVFCSPKDMDEFNIEYGRMEALRRVSTRKLSSPSITIRRGEKVMPMVKTLMLDWIKTPEAGFKQEGDKWGITWLKKVTPEMIV